MARVMPMRGPLATRLTPGRPRRGSISSGPVVRSRPLSASVMPSARVTLPGPLASRGVAAATPRRRTIVAMPSRGSSARMSTQPGVPARPVMAFRQ